MNNSFCESPNSQTSEPSSEGNSNIIGQVIGYSISSLAIIGCCALAYWYHRRKQSKIEAQKSSQEPIGNAQAEVQNFVPSGGSHFNSIRSEPPRVKMKSVFSVDHENQQSTLRLIPPVSAHRIRKRSQADTDQKPKVVRVEPSELPASKSLIKQTSIDPRQMAKFIRE